MFLQNARMKHTTFINIVFPELPLLYTVTVFFISWEFVVTKHKTCLIQASWA